MYSYFWLECTSRGGGMQNCGICGKMEGLTGFPVFSHDRISHTQCRLWLCYYSLCYMPFILLIPSPELHPTLMCLLIGAQGMSESEPTKSARAPTSV